MGESHQRAKASDELVRQARHLRSRHGMTYSKIAQQLGHSKETIRDWCEYRTRRSA